MLNSFIPVCDFTHIEDALICHHYLKRNVQNTLTPKLTPTFEQANWLLEYRTIAQLAIGIQGLNHKLVPCLIYRIDGSQFIDEFALVARDFKNPVIIQKKEWHEPLHKFEVDIADCLENFAIDEEPDFQPILLGGLLQILLRSKKLSLAEKSIITHICNETIIDHADFNADLAKDMWAKDAVRDLLVLFKTHRVNDFDWKAPILGELVPTLEQGE